MAGYITIVHFGGHSMEKKNIPFKRLSSLVRMIIWMFFERSRCSPGLHLFDQEYIKTWNIITI